MQNIQNMQTRNLELHEMQSINGGGLLDGVLGNNLLGGLLGGTGGVTNLLGNVNVGVGAQVANAITGTAAAVGLGASVS